MKVLYTSFPCLFAFSACTGFNDINNKQSDNKTPKENPELIGGQKDEHGCLVSAGETWSQMKQECIQIFNVGQRLNPLDIKSGDAVFSAFILFNENQSELELFLPHHSNTALLIYDANKAIYQSNEFQYNLKDSCLYVSGKKSYKIESITPSSK